MKYERKDDRRNSTKGTRIVLIVLCAVLTLVLVALIAATAFMEYIFGEIERPDEQTRGTLSSEQMETIFNTEETIDPTFDGVTIDPSDVTWGTEPSVPVVDNPDIINILLIGTDGRWLDELDRSDSMILCTFNTLNNTVTMTSFMRDMYVQIPGYEDNRINTAYTLGGMALLEETLTKNFGVHIDACVKVNFFGFPEIVDLLGGIDIELTQEEADYLNANGNWGVVGGTPGGVWQLTGGMNHLNGEQTLAYSRIRAIGDDFGRTERQRKVLTIVMEQCKTMNLTQALELLNTALPLVGTDMTNQQITSYAMDLFPMLSDLHVVSQRVPVYGTYTNAVIRGMQVLLPDIPAIQKILKNTGVIYELEEN